MNEGLYIDLNGRLLDIIKISDEVYQELIIRGANSHTYDYKLSGVNFTYEIDYNNR